MLFSQVLDTVRRQGDDWTAEAPESWGQGRTIFGGLQGALAVRAMRDLVPQTVPLRVLQAKYDVLERRIATFPTISVATITLEGDANDAPHGDPSVYAKKYRASTSTAPSQAASATTCRRRRPRPSRRRSSMLTGRDDAHCLTVHFFNRRS